MTIERKSEVATNRDPIEIDWNEARRIIEEEGGILIDLRKAEDVKKEPLPSARRVDVDDILLYKFKFDKGKKYVFVDYLGITSKILCEYLKKLGIEAFAIKGGIKGIKKE